jgi:DNA-binding CsgD family transcriptional regulator/tetratricopeptide (TPR) repeat protein
LIFEQTTFRAFAGRRAELDVLLAAFRNAKAAQQGAAIVLWGEGGIGKTRLVDEFANRVKRERCTVLRGACLEYLSTPYQPFVEALASSRTGAKLEAELRGAAVDRSHGSDVERLRRFQLVADDLRRQAAIDGCIVLVVEDLHWSDSASLDLARFLTKRLHDAPVLQLFTLRDEEPRTDAARARQVAALRAQATASLKIGPLTDADIRDLVRSALHDREAISPHDVQAIAALAEGSPLFAEELLRGALDRSQRDAQAPIEPAVSLRATVLERLASFDETTRRVVTTAAVVGRDFDVDLLARIGGASTAEILAALRSALRAQLVVEDRRGAYFRFRHALTREIVYRELLLVEARTLHRRIAEALDGGAAPDEAAYHWWAGHVPERSIPENEAAGDRAGAMCAYADAATFYERAASLASDDVRDGIVRKLTFALCVIGEMRLAQAVSNAESAALRARGRESDAQRLLLWAARQLYEAGEVDRAVATAEAVCRELERQPPMPIHYSAAMTLAGMQATLGRAQEALSTLDRAEGLPVERDPIDRFRSHNARGNALCSLGAYGRARDEYTVALSIARNVENVELEIHALISLSNAALMLGSLAESMEKQNEARTLAESHGLRRHALIALAATVHAALYGGKLNEALDGYRTIAESRSIAPLTQAFARAAALRLRSLLKMPTGLDEFDAAEAVDVALSLRESQIIAAVTGAAARSALERGELNLAHDFAQRGIAAITEPDHAYWLCDVVAELLDGESVRKARDLIELACAGGSNPLASAMRDLFDARRARRVGDSQAGALLASQASERLQGLGVLVEAALANEVAGDLSAARDAWHHMGATEATRRLQGRAAAPNAGSTSLTPREAQVAALAARGYANPDIATELRMGRRTVETHLATAYRKLGVKSRSELSAVLHAPR